MKYLKKISVYVIIFLSLITVFIGLLTVSAALPKNRSFMKNIRYSAKHLYEEKDWPNVGGVKLDNYTDSLILNVCFSFDSSSPLKSALNPGYAYPASEEPGISAVHYLNVLVSDHQPEMKFYSYRRYWFGHSAVMKILLYFAHLKKIQSSVGFITILLLFMCCIRVLKKDGMLPALALFSLLGFCCLHVFFLSLQYYPVIWIGLIGLLILDKFSRPDWRGPIFFSLGMLTAFFDLLTAPVLAFGIPAMIICGRDAQMEEKGGNRSRTAWLRIWFGYPAAWLAGYIISWGTKILLGVLSGGNWNEIIQQILLRSGNSFEGKKITMLDALQENFRDITSNSSLVLILVLCWFVYFLIRRLIEWKQGKLYFIPGIVLGYLFLAVMPIAVIMLMVNHTYQHAYMTFRGLSLTFASLLMLLTAFQPVAEEKKPD
ncbi:MAG: hypothetical protein IKO93_11960 [Lentisphaeria bacterium]|nr:hypothetical protein [Lentisphaeria bacterium]